MNRFCNTLLPFIVAGVLIVGCGPEPQTPTPTSSPTSTPVSPIVTQPQPTQPAGALKLNENTGAVSSPRMALDGASGLHLVWRDLSSRSEGDIVYRQMLPSGEWTPAEKLSEEFERVGDPVLVRKPSGEVCAFWHGWRSKTYGLYLRCRVGGSWAAAELVGERGVTASFAPAFAPDGTVKMVYEVPPSVVGFEDTEFTDGKVSAANAALAIDTAGGYHAVWQSFTDPFRLSYRYSSDGGKTWGDVQSLNEGIFFVPSPVLIADRMGNVHLFWVRAEVYYRRWTPSDGWGPITQIKGGSGIKHATIDSTGQAHVVWGSTNDIFYTRQQSDGTWTQPGSVVTNTVGPVEEAVIVVDDQQGRHFVWSTASAPPGLFYIYSAR